MAQKLVHYLNEDMAYTGCWKVKDNGIIQLETTDISSEVTCQDCLARKGKPR